MRRGNRDSFLRVALVILVICKDFASASVLSPNAVRGAFDHRVFPAAQLEVYNHNDPSRVLGVLSVVNLSFTTELWVQASSSLESSRTVVDPAVDEILLSAVQRFRKSLQRLPDFIEDYKVNPLNLTLHTITSLQLLVRSNVTKLYHGVPEDYELTISIDSHSIRLNATTVFGVIRGMETLSQLLEFGWMSKTSSTTSSSSSSSLSVAVYCIRDIPLYISDAPSYPFRGLMIDTSRHFLPLNLILDNLDAMAMNKLNILHWHLTDEQSFPFALPSYPDLAEKGAFHPKRIYSSTDVQTVIHEAYLRGIRVIPEIDMPGHTASIAKSHPEVMSHCPEPDQPINPTIPATLKFVQGIYKDLNDIFPDEFFHVGGDEVWMSEQCWLNDTSIVAWMHENHMNETVQLYQYFETKLLDIVASVGKTPVVWQEVFNLNLTITPNAIVDVWKGFDQETIQNATNRGFRVIVSGCWYLDHLDQTWESFYKCDPRNFTGNKDLVIGGHASMWGEHVDTSNFISKTWPRASAVAERLWTGDVSGGPTQTVSQRIHNFRCHMVQQGFAAGPTGPGSCPREVPYRSRDCWMAERNVESIQASEKGSFKNAASLEHVYLYRRRVSK